MTSEFKDYRSDDVVPMCENHHQEYEDSSRALLNRLLSEHSDELTDRELARRGRKAMKTLRSEWLHKIPQERRELLSEDAQHADLKVLSDHEILMKYYSSEEIIDLWKEDFLNWMKQQGHENFTFVK